MFVSAANPKLALHLWGLILGQHLDWHQKYDYRQRERKGFPCGKLHA
jgi:hypothetical protein